MVALLAQEASYPASVCSRGLVSTIHCAVGANVVTDQRKCHFTTAGGGTHAESKLLAAPGRPRVGLAEQQWQERQGKRRQRGGAAKSGAAVRNGA